MTGPVLYNSVIKSNIKLLFAIFITLLNQAQVYNAWKIIKNIIKFSLKIGKISSIYLHCEL